MRYEIIIRKLIDQPFLEPDSLDFEEEYSEGHWHIAGTHSFFRAILIAHVESGPKRMVLDGPFDDLSDVALRKLMDVAGASIHAQYLHDECQSVSPT